MTPNPSTTVISNLAYALAYAKRGWPVFPLHEVFDGGVCSCGNECNNAGKHPRTKHGFKNATTDPEQIRAYWSTWPNAPIGLVTGRASGLVIVDIDPRNGGAATWNALVAEHGAPITMRVRTGGAGEHLYFKSPAFPVGSKGNGLGPGVDIKADGGYVVAPPSKHLSGNRYEFAEFAGPGDIELAECPDWIVSRVFKTPHKAPSKTPGKSTVSGCDGWLAVAFAAAGRLGDRLPNGAWAAKCPWADQHSSKNEGSSTVVFPPDAAHSMGWFHCSHAHCAGRTLDEVKAALPVYAIAMANSHYPPRPQGEPESQPPSTPPESGEVPIIDQGPSPAPEPHAWQSDLIMKNSTIVPVVANLTTILAHDERWEGVLAWDEFSEKAIKRRPAPWHSDDGGSDCGPVDDDDAVRLANWMVRYWGARFSSEACWQAIQVAAKRNPYHPVRSYLEGVVWDGILRLPNWTTVYLGAKDTPYHRAVGFRWMIAAVARIMRPGCRADCALILEGLQGKKKSSALAALASDPWFADDVGDLRTKDSADALRGKWIIELGELSAVRKADAELVKLYLSRRIDHYRPAYGRLTIDRPRQCVFGATTNATEYQNDPTGLRRFWAVACATEGPIDVAAIIQDRDQLWAEAMHWFAQGEQWWLADNEAPDQIEEQSLRQEIDPWAEPLMRWLEEKAWGDVTITRVLAECFKLELRQQQQSDARRVGRLLRVLGWEQTKQIGPRGCRVKVWEQRSKGDQ